MSKNIELGCYIDKYICIFKINILRCRHEILKKNMNEKIKKIVWIKN